MRFYFRLLYLDNLKFLDEIAFVSWHIVSSKVEIVFWCFSTMSGLNNENTLEIGRYDCPTRSTKTSHSCFTADTIHWANISKTLSCRFLYRARADGDPQLFNECLFVCMAPHNEHLSESDFFQRNRFEAVASCCWKAFLTNEKSMPSSRVLIIVDHFLIVAPSKASLTAENNFPWTLSDETCSTALVSCSDCSACIAEDLVGSRSSRESSGMLLRDESFQIFLKSVLSLCLRI